MRCTTRRASAFQIPRRPHLGDERREVAQVARGDARSSSAAVNARRPLVLGVGSVQLVLIFASRTAFWMYAVSRARELGQTVTDVLVRRAAPIGQMPTSA